MIKKLLINSTLLLILFVLIGTPAVSSVLLTKLEEMEPTAVLSSQDTKDKDRVTEDSGGCGDFPAVGGQDETNVNIPKDIEMVIRKLEQEFYQTTESIRQVEPDILSP